MRTKLKLLIAMSLWKFVQLTNSDATMAVVSIIFGDAISTTIAETEVTKAKIAKILTGNAMKHRNLLVKTQSVSPRVTVAMVKTIAEIRAMKLDVVSSNFSTICLDRWRLFQ